MKRLIAAVLLTASTAFAQPHVPSSSVDGYTVTFDANVVEIVPAPDSVVAGTILSGTLFASPDFLSNIAVTLIPGTSYSIRMLGQSEDPSNPNRQVVTEVLLVSMTDRDRIREAWADLGGAIATLRALAADFDTLAAALDQESDGSQ